MTHSHTHRSTGRKVAAIVLGVFAVSFTWDAVNSAMALISGRAEAFLMADVAVLSILISGGIAAGLWCAIYVVWNGGTKQKAMAARRWIGRISWP